MGAVEPEAIFIVGVSRSGTTLMRRILDSHSRIAIATENHYLGHLLPWEGARSYFHRVGDLRTDGNVRRLVRLIYSDEFQASSRLRELSPYWRWLVRSVEPSEVERRLLACDRSDREMFEVFLRLYADRRGKPIPGEKTPAHLAYVETLLAWFPGGRVIHMIRDPRAVYESEVRRRSENAVTVPYRWLVRLPLLLRTFVLFEVTWAWASAVNRHRELSRRYQVQYRLVRFEDLVTDPEAVIGDLCTYLGVEMEPRMLKQKVTSKGSNVGQGGFDASAADRWRSAIDPRAERALCWLLGRRLAELGYRR